MHYVLLCFTTRSLFLEAGALISKNNVIFYGAQIFHPIFAITVVARLVFYVQYALAMPVL